MEGNNTFCDVQIIYNIVFEFDPAVLKALKVADNQLLKADIAK